MHAPNPKRATANLWKLNIMQFCSGMLLAIPVIVLFYQAHGLSLTQVFLLQGIFSVSILIMEIPSGYASDRWGRKKTAMAGALGVLLGYFTYALSDGFIPFALAELFIGFGTSFLSGTLEALTYDSLLEIKKESSYRAITGHQYFLHMGSEAAASPIGGFLAAIALNLPFWAMLIPMGITVIAACTLYEPSRHRLQETRHFKAMWDITTHVLIKDARLRSITILHALISTMTLSLFWFTQPYQSLIALPVVFFGITHGVIVAAGAFASKGIVWLEQRMDDRKILVTITCVVVGGYLLLGLPAGLWGLGVFLAVRIAWSILTPLTLDMINSMTTSDVRATTLSIRAFAGRSLFVVLSPLLAILADTQSLQFALVTGGVAGAILIGMVFVLMRGVWGRLPS